MSDLPRWVSALYRATADIEAACDQIGRMDKDNDRLADALRLAIPVMRKTVFEYLESVCIRNDPATISRMDWAEIAPDIAAIRAAEACVGPQPDQEGGDGGLAPGARRSSGEG